MDKAVTSLSLYIKTVITPIPPRGKEDERERVRVEFAENPTKINIMKAKKNPKQVKVIWINDDLIPSRAKLARQSVKSRTDIPNMYL